MQRASFLPLGCVLQVSPVVETPTFSEVTEEDRKCDFDDFAPKSLGHTHITARPALWEEGLHRDAKHGKVDERLGRE